MAILKLYSHDDDRDDLDEIAQDVAAEAGCSAQEALAVLEQLPLHTVEAHYDLEAGRIVGVRIGRQWFEEAAGA